MIQKYKIPDRLSFFFENDGLTAGFVYGGKQPEIHAALESIVGNEPARECLALIVLIAQGNNGIGMFRLDPNETTAGSANWPAEVIEAALIELEVAGLITPFK